MLNIVLCSQHPAQLLWLDHYFRRANHSCRSTTEWDVLLGVIRQSHVDAVLLDASMGDTEARCRQLRLHSATPLIVVGAQAAPEERERLIAAGADDVIAEWTPFEELLARTEQKLRHKQNVVAG